MFDVHFVPALPEAISNKQSDSHRSMPPAGAAESDCQIALSFAPITR